MTKEAWFADLVASARALPRRDAGWIVIDVETGRVVAANDRAAELLGAPIPDAVLGLVDVGLLARPDLDRIRADVVAWSRTVPLTVREVARSWTFDVRVHPPGSAGRLLHVDAVHHIRRYDDAEAVILEIRPAAPEDGDRFHSPGAWPQWALYDFQVRGLAFEPFPVLLGDHRDLVGVLVASLVSPDDLARVLPAVVPVFEGRLALARYCCDYRVPGTAPVGLECDARAVAGSGEIGTPSRRYLMVSREAPRRDAILPEIVTERQLAVLDAIFAGERPQQIAETQGVGVSTIRFHLAGAYQALGVSGRDELVARYCPPCLVEEPVTVSIVEEDGVRFPLPEGPPGMIGVTETRRLEGIDGWFEVALTRWTAGSDRERIPDGVLTAKETAVVAALFDGLRPAAIAEREGVAVKTVRKRLSSAYAKLGVDGQAALTRTYERPAG